jgi:hypothetical protein
VSFLRSYEKAGGSGEGFPNSEEVPQKIPSLQNPRKIPSLQVPQKIPTGESGR